MKKTSIVLGASGLIGRLLILDLLQKSNMEGFSTKFVSSFEIELKVNTFFRLKEKSIKESLKNANLLSKNDSPQEVFLALRELRNKW